MKTLILAGGYGTRISEESQLKPKPMIEIGGKPILWHIMKLYSKFGHNEFIILLGYKGYVIKEYFINYFYHQSDITIDIKSNNINIHNTNAEPWKITLLDTGLNTQTGGRIKQAEKFINNEPFMLTYGDGVSNININDLTNFHKNHGKLITMSSTQPEGRFGALNIDKDNKITQFLEKPKGDGSWVNIGFFVCEPNVLNYLSNDSNCIFERAPLENLAKDNELYTFQHTGFWKCMDTLRDKQQLEKMWQNKPEWKVWD